MGDVTDAAVWDDVLAGVRPEVVVHLAAETGTGQSMYEIDRYVTANIGGTATLLDLLTNETHSVRRIVVASSRSVYGEGAYRTEAGELVFPPPRSAERMAAGDFEVHMPGEGALQLVPTPETAPLHPSSIYGICKQTQEALVMTAAAAIGLEAFIDDVDFLSIGTNDLVQYLLAADRNHEALGELYSPLHPAVLRLLRHVIATAAGHDTPVAVCGEIAGDPRFVPMLLALGLTELSLHPATLLEVRRAIRASDLSALTARAPRLLRARDRKGIEKWLEL